MRPERPLDSTAFFFLLLGALSWAYFVTDANIPYLLPERIWDPFEEIVFVLIGLSGLYRRALARFAEADEAS